MGETHFGVLPLTQRQPLAVPATATKITATVGTARLSAYTIQDNTITLYWQAGDPMSEDGTVFIHFFDAQGNFVMGVDSRPRDGAYSTLAWQKGEGIVDAHPVPPSLPPGKYMVKIGMYDATTQNRLTVVDGQGQSVPDGELTLGSYTAVSP